MIAVVKQIERSQALTEEPPTKFHTKLKNKVS